MSVVAIFSDSDVRTELTLKAFYSPSAFREAIESTGLTLAEASVCSFFGWSHSFSSGNASIETAEDVYRCLILIGITPGTVDCLAAYLDCFSPAEFAAAVDCHGSAFFGSFDTLFGDAEACAKEWLQLCDNFAPTDEDLADAKAFLAEYGSRFDGGYIVSRF